MNLNYLMPVLNTLLKRGDEDEVDLSEDIKQMVSALIFKILLGLVCCAILTVATVYLGNIFLLWLGKFDDGVEWKIGVLSSIIILSSLSLTILFLGLHSKKKNEERENHREFMRLIWPNYLCILSLGL